MARRLNPYKITRLVIIIALIVIAITMTGRACSSSEPDATLDNKTTKVSVTEPEPPLSAADRLDAILDITPRHNPYQAHFDSMPPGGIKLHVNYLGGTLGSVFNDSNHLHLEAARAIGITPIANGGDIWNNSRPLVKIESNANYYVDDLTHSHPYLVPEAARLLNDIGRMFRDTLTARGGGDYRIKVTSILRTPLSVASLRRRNVNATSESTHLYGTTFDISYSKFICDDPVTPRTQEDLKNLLGELLFTLREQGRCLVKYERKQSCFHITATGR